MPENYLKALKYVLSREGGYSNNKYDLGGETNKGITHITYDTYCKSKGLPQKSVKHITDQEVADIYYNNYYKASGADKLKDPGLALVVFDTAVNMGVSRANKFLQESNGDVNKYLSLRKEKYKEFVKHNPRQEKFLQGWTNRVNHLQKYVDTEYTNEPIQKTNNNYKPVTLKGNVSENIYLEPLTPYKEFTREDIAKMDRKTFEQNLPAIEKQMREKGIRSRLEFPKNCTGYQNKELENTGRIFTREEIGKMSLDEYKNNEKAISLQQRDIGIPLEWDLQNSSGTVYVEGYIREDGVKVKSYYRSAPTR